MSRYVTATFMMRGDDSPETAAESIHAFADYLTLAYHEARNVRHLVKAGFADKSLYGRLVGLPIKREEAWNALQRLRVEARHAKSARKAESIFHKKFGVSLQDLVQLSENPHWKGSPYGGNKWAEIDRAIIELRDALDSKDKNRSRECRERLRTMRHNTGSVTKKLSDLDAQLSSSPA